VGERRVDLKLTRQVAIRPVHLGVLTRMQLRSLLGSLAKLACTLGALVRSNFCYAGTGYRVDATPTPTRIQGPAFMRT